MTSSLASWLRSSTRLPDSPVWGLAWGPRAVGVADKRCDERHKAALDDCSCGMLRTMQVTPGPPLDGE